MRIPTRLATAATMLLLVSACGGLTDEANRLADPSAQSSSKADHSVDPGQERNPWAIHQITGWEVEWYDSLPSLTDSADLVAVGTVTDARPGRTWVESEGDETMTSEMTVYTVELGEILGGKPVGPTSGEITLEFGPNTPSAVEERTAVVGETSLFILRRKGAPIPSIERLEPMKDEFAREVYRVVNSAGLIDEVNGAAELPLGEADQAWSAELERGSFADVVERVRAAVAQGS